MCIGGKQSFCDTHASFSLTASCVVVATFPHGISLKVLHILHNSESRDPIKVWDIGGPYNSCMDSLTSASAAHLGDVGDTLILALNKIDTISNIWDVVGEYRTPFLPCNVYRLTVANNTVLGFISGSMDCSTTSSCLNTYNYDEFLVDFPTKSINCETWLSTDEPSSQKLLSYHPNPASDNFIFSTTESGTLTITNQLGQFIEAVSITDNQTQISTRNLLSGIYFLTYQTKRNTITRKLIVQQ